MKIKICGITRYEDVSKCEASGANLIGYINIERSERYVKTRRIKELVSTMRNREKAVLVLEPENPGEAVMKMKKTGIRNVQLHSLTSKEIKYLRWIEDFHRNALESNVNIIRAVGLSDESLYSLNGSEFVLSNSKKEEIEGFAKTCDAILFDYQINGKTGGTGGQIPINIVLESIKIAKSSNRNVDIFLAGGLNSEIIRKKKDILKMVIDYVDVNSGVESAPGIKNPDQVDDLMKIRALI
jgi:phosphoribosylanthranilate isomerase